jgi:hypothetical protein
MSAIPNLIAAMNELLERAKEKLVTEPKEDVARKLWDGRDSREERAFEPR